MAEFLTKQEWWGVSSMNLDGGVQQRRQFFPDKRCEARCVGNMTIDIQLADAARDM